jgi:hypothetical protein
MKIDGSFERGEEVTYTYSANNDALQLLYSQGMAFENNPHSSVSIQIGSPKFSRANQI